MTKWGYSRNAGLVQYSKISQYNPPYLQSKEENPHKLIN